MAEHPCMPLWTDAYLGDTSHLTTTEHGAYLLLLITMWRNKGSLPNDDRLLARYARLTSTQWRRMKPTIMDFFEVDGERVRQSRLTDEYKAVRQHSVKQSDRAKARWLKEKKTDMPAHQSGNASPYPYPTTTTPSDSSDEESSVVVGRPAPSQHRYIDPKKLVYDQGKRLLSAYGIANGKAGGLITKWLRQHPPGRLIVAFMEAGATERSNIIEYIGGVLKDEHSEAVEAKRERHARVLAKIDARGQGEV